jgi:hypothetical protein
MRTLLTLLCIVGSCDDNPAGPTAALDVPFSLQQGQTAVLDSAGTTIRFERVLNDGRCPSDVMCVWEGEASIEVKVGTPGMPPASIKLKIPGYVDRNDSLRHRPADTLGYRFTLMQLDPYPKHAPPRINAVTVALIKVARLFR